MSKQVRAVKIICFDGKHPKTLWSQLSDQFEEEQQEVFSGRGARVITPTGTGSEKMGLLFATTCLILVSENISMKITFIIMKLHLYNCEAFIWGGMKIMQRENYENYLSYLLQLISVSFFSVVVWFWQNYIN